MQDFTRRWPGGSPSVVTVLLVVNVLCFFAQTICELASPGSMEHYLELSRNGLQLGFYWQLITYTFLHAGPLHLLVNLLTLYFAGREVEAIVGPRHLLAVYFGGGVLGGVAHLLFTTAPVLGASAGVLAVFIAFTTILPELELTLLLFFVVPVKMKARYLAYGLVGTSLFFAATGTGGNVGHVAHLGGCLLGWIYAKQLGFGNPLRIQKYIFARRQQAERHQRMSPSQFISAEIDPILDKISREGIHSLTRSERRILEKGREKIAHKTARL